MMIYAKKSLGDAQKKREARGDIKGKKANETQQTAGIEGV